MKLSLLSVVVLGIAATLAGTPPQGEPMRGGLPLSAWVKQLPVPGEFDQGRERYATNPAVSAVRQIGTEALPFLLGWIQKPGKVGRTDATLGLIFLGDTAKPAIPQLVVLLNKAELTDDAAIVLRRLGVEGLRAITNGFASPSPLVRASAILSLCSETTHDPKHSNDVEVVQFKQQRTLAVPGIIALLRDLNYEVAGAAVYALGNFNQERDLVIPALTAVANNTAADARVRKAALKTLKRLGVLTHANEDVKSK